MATQKPAQSVAGWSQDKQRTQRIFFDQHKCARFPEGRPWWTNSAERSAIQEGALTQSAMPMPVGDLNPMGWSAPFMPPQKYFEYAMGLADQVKIRINYVQMQRDDLAATNQWAERAIKEAASLRLVPLPTKREILAGKISWELEQVVGQAPRSPKIAEACIAGDEWILGLKEARRNSRTGEWVVEENEILARLLQSRNEWMPTPEETAREIGDVEQMKAELAQMRQDLEAALNVPKRAPKAPRAPRRRLPNGSFAPRAEAETVTP